MLTQKVLQKCLNYCPRSGEFTTLTDDAAKRKDSDGYQQIAIRDWTGEMIGYPAHRLAWLYVHGEMPEVIDHVNMDRGDNRIDNLHNVTPEENARRAGCRGLYTTNYIRSCDREFARQEAAKVKSRLDSVLNGAFRCQG